jgi:predicted nucleic acid-binding protein
MILIDTPVWIRFLANRTPYAAELDQLLAGEEVLGHELVYGELLIGDSGGRRKFLTLYERIPQARTLPHPEVVEFIRDRRLYGRGIGWIDAHLLSSALVERSYLWTADARLSAIAAELGIAHQNSGSPPS